MDNPLPSVKAKQYAVRAVEVAQERAPWVGQLARLGYLSIGVVYLLIGLLASLEALGLGGRVTSTGGAARTVLEQPFGRVLLGIITAGLVVFVAWRGAQSILDVEDRGRSRMGLMRRLGLALSGLSYSGLAAVAVERMVTGSGRVEDPKGDWTAQLLQHPTGAFLVGVLGLAVILVGLRQFYSAYQAGFVTYLNSSLLGAASKRWLTWLGRYGLAMRGVIFSLIGVLLVRAAWHTNPEQAKGLSGALYTLSSQPYGRWLLGAVALGLGLYGVFMLSKVRYRHLVPAEDEEET